MFRMSKMRLTEMRLMIAIFSVATLAQAHSPKECPKIEGDYTDQGNGMKISAKTKDIQNGVKYSLEPWAGENEIIVDGHEHPYYVGGQSLYQISVCSQSGLTFSIIIPTGFEENKYAFVEYTLRQLNENGDLSVVSRTSTRPGSDSTIWTRNRK